ncbi:MAG: HAD family hydrolase [Actinobacteria bacterium]|nr:HAD family hydrolase [Actinomycetota bacterium]
MKVKAATFDIGGVLYSDDAFKRAIFSALNQLTTVSKSDFDQVYLSHLKSQSGSLRSKLCEAFLGSLDKKGELMKLTNIRWLFNDNDQYQDGRECLIKLKQAGFRIGIVANQPKSSADRLKQDDLMKYIDFLGISAIVGFEKPDPAFFKLAIEELALAAEEIIHIGNRIDTDVRPAKALGMKTVWVRRGEANPEPSKDELAAADITVSDLKSLPELISSL